MKTPISTLPSIYVSNADELNSAIDIANKMAQGDTLTIILQTGFSVSFIQHINTQGTLTIQSANGTPVDLDGANKAVGFGIFNGNVTLENLNILNMGLNGETCGGFLSAGSGLFVMNTNGYSGAQGVYAPVVVLTNVSFTACIASGGAGGVNPGGTSMAPKKFLKRFLKRYVFPENTAGQAMAGMPIPGSFGVNSLGNAIPAGYGAGASCGTLSKGSGQVFAYESNGFGGSVVPNPAQNGSQSQRDLGGNAFTFGGGAAFGGAVFIMDNANITFTGSGVISRNVVSSSPPYPGSAAGSGIFLQGSGQLNFNIDSSDTYTIANDLCDETGAVRTGSANIVQGTIGTDGLPTGGGTGVWTIKKSGSGTLNFNGSLLISGKIYINGGTLELSRCSNINSEHLILNEHTVLVHKPSIEPTCALKLQALLITESTELFLNGYSRISAESITFPSKLAITVDSAAFVSGKAVEVITWKKFTGSLPEVTVTSGFTCRVGQNSICISKNE